MNASENLLKTTPKETSLVVEETLVTISIEDELNDRLPPPSETNPLLILLPIAVITKDGEIPKNHELPIDNPAIPAPYNNLLKLKLKKERLANTLC